MRKPLPPDVHTCFLLSCSARSAAVGLPVFTTAYYRYNLYALRGLCTHNKLIRETAVEEWLFAHLREELEKYRLEWELKEVQRKQAAASIDRANIRRKLARLQELYVNELIDLENYRRNYELYTAQLAERPEPVGEKRPDFEAVEVLLGNGFRNIYDGLTREEKRTVWRSAIREIHVNNDREITRIVFL